MGHGSDWLRGTSARSARIRDRHLRQNAANTTQSPAVRPPLAAAAIPATARRPAGLAGILAARTAETRPAAFVVSSNLAARVNGRI